MCIAIVKTKEGQLTDQVLRNCFKNNPDGAGIAYSKDNQLYMIKGIFDEDAFITAYHNCEAEADGAMLVHCRIATSGKTDYDNCHPHVVHNSCVMIHNGVLDIDVPKGSAKSDTVLFVEKLLRPLPEHFMFNEAIMNLITFTIGNSNKFCFLHSTGAFAIANEEAGTWVDGVWFSNDSYKDDYKRYTKFGYYSSWDYDYDDWAEDWGAYNGTYGGAAQREFDMNHSTLSADDWMSLESMILNLTPDKFLELGDEPVYLTDKKILLPDTDDVNVLDAFDMGTADYLSNIDEYLFDLYSSMYDYAYDRAVTLETDSLETFDEELMDGDIDPVNS